MSSSSISVKKAPLNMKNKDHFTLGQLREAGDMLLNQGKLDEADGMTVSKQWKLVKYVDLASKLLFVIILLNRNVYEGFRPL